MGARTSGRQKRLPENASDLIQAVERRLGLQLQLGVHWRIFDSAKELLESGEAHSKQMVTSVKRGSISSDKFQPPAGFSKIEMTKFGQ